MEAVDVAGGFDVREAIAYHVFCQRVLERATMPVRFLPVALQTVAGYVEHHRDGSNAFVCRRFLTSCLMGLGEWATFASGDMVCQEDTAELWRLRDASKAVLVVKHDY